MKVKLSYINLAILNTYFAEYFDTRCSDSWNLELTSYHCECLINLETHQLLDGQGRCSFQPDGIPDLNPSISPYED